MAPVEPIKPLNVHTRASFVREGVKENAVTTQIIDKLYPYFPKECIVIAGFLNVSDQYWKVNYHWDLLMSKIDEFLAMKGIADPLLKAAKDIKSKLMTNPPDPLTGYKDDKTVGQTKDSSGTEKITARHGQMMQAKKDFEDLIVKAKIVTASSKDNPPAKEKMWWLAVSAVAPPGDSKHGTGHALDIAGNNAETARISRALGASLVFNEASHVHTEWRNGVQIPT
jgi:hypothetical protein